VIIRGSQTNAQAEGRARIPKKSVSIRSSQTNAQAEGRARIPK
jgi:hypothetical protein